MSILMLRQIKSQGLQIPKKRKINHPTCGDKIDRWRSRNSAKYTRQKAPFTRAIQPFVKRRKYD